MPFSRRGAVYTLQASIYWTASLAVIFLVFYLIFIHLAPFLVNWDAFTILESEDDEMINFDNQPIKYNPNLHRKYPEESLVFWHNVPNLPAKWQDTFSEIHALIDGRKFRVDDSALSASSYHRMFGTICLPQCSRWTPNRESCKSCMSWAAKAPPRAERRGPKIYGTEWIQVKLGRTWTILELVTGGRDTFRGMHYIKEFFLTAVDRGVISRYPNNTHYRIFDGTLDKETERLHHLTPEMRAHTVRLNVVSYQYTSALRWELFGVL